MQTFSPTSLSAAHEESRRLQLSDCADLGAQIIRNILQNSPRLNGAKPALGIAGKFSGVPAVICGAGPSLQKSLPFLSSLKERALVFGGGSSLHALSQASIIPHFAAALDPAPPRHLFANSAVFDVPFFYLQRVCPYLLSLVHGQLLLVPENGRYPLEGWLAGDETTLDAGWNVATCCMAIARMMGCGPIILVGMDLSCKTEKLGDETLLPVGNALFARADWIAAREWIEQFEGEVINATEGGVGFRGVPERSLAEITLPKQGDLEGKIHAILQEMEPAQMGNRCALIEESLARSGPMCDALLAKLGKIGLGELALREVELEEELAIQKIVLPIWDAWRDHLPAVDELAKLLFFKRVIDAIAGP